MPSLSPNQLDSVLNVDDQQNEILSDKQHLSRLDRIIEEHGEYGNSEAKIIIFRLEDPSSPGIFVSNGSASIHLGPDGKVAKISGLNEG